MPLRLAPTFAKDYIYILTFCKWESAGSELSSVLKVESISKNTAWPVPGLRTR